MRAAIRKIAIAAAAAVTIVGATTALPSTADARWGGHWHGGGGHWHGGWGGWGGWGLGLGTGLAVGLAAAPFYGGYGYGPYYGAYANGGDCVMQRRWVVNRWGHRVLRWVRVCY